MSIRRFTLDSDTRVRVDELTSSLAGACHSMPEPAFAQEVLLAAHELPRHLRRVLTSFRLREQGWGALIVGNIPIDDSRLAPTPGHWRDTVSTERENVLLLLLAALVGDAFGWTTQQDGKLVHDVLPIRANESVQVGSGSKVRLTLHTEDAFHPYRPDFIALLCLRNPDRVATHLGCLDDIGLDEATIDALYEDGYVLVPDVSHSPAQNVATDTGFDFVIELERGTEQVSIFYGDRTAPYLRFDPYYTLPPTMPRHRQALEALDAEFERTLREVTLEPGELLFVDNARVVHGRAPFAARYDGADRWLKRVCLTLDLRKSRTLRDGERGRLIGAGAKA